MTGLSLEVRSRDLSVAGKRLDQLLAGLDDASPLMDEIGSIVVASTLHRFETETGPDGRRWAPSARARDEGGQTLTDTARLRTSFTHSYDRDSAAVGTNVIYAAIHHFGGTIRPKGDGKLKFRIGGGWVQVDQVTMPARPILGVDADDEAEISHAAREYLIGVMRP